jgi:DNA-binding NarL/FixJ family response regulator
MTRGCRMVEPSRLPESRRGPEAAMGSTRSPSRPWTSGEVNRLSDLLEAGRTADEIAAELDRTAYAVYSRLQRLYRKRLIRDTTRGKRQR